MAGKPKPEKSRLRRTFDWGERMLQGFKPIEAGLFGLGGYYLGDVLNSTGLPRYIHDHVKPVGDWIDTGYNSDLPNAHNTFGFGGGNAMVKVAGVGAFVGALAKAAKSGLSSKSLNSVLPFSIGAMIDAPNEASEGVSGYSTGGDRWSA